MRTSARLVFYEKMKLHAKFQGLSLKNISIALWPGITYFIISASLLENLSLGSLRTTNVQTSLGICADRSAPLLFTY